jgi:hypothetical protein
MLTNTKVKAIKDPLLYLQAYPLVSILKIRIPDLKSTPRVFVTYDKLSGTK